MSLDIPLRSMIVYGCIINVRMMSWVHVKQSFTSAVQNSHSENIRKTHKMTMAMESFFSNVEETVRTKKHFRTAVLKDKSMRDFVYFK